MGSKWLPKVMDLAGRMDGRAKGLQRGNEGSKASMDGA